ncbi:MAG: hypothetical protein IT169_05775 [Bryobacterales bacterium]|nr:hypothetical protein [Bryobacterales bacterium]
MKYQVSARNRGTVSEELRTEDRFSTSLASLARMLASRRAASESERVHERMERQPEGDAV